MNAQEIEDALKGIKADSIGRIIGKNKAIDKIHRQHLVEMDNALMDVRVFVAQVSTGHSTSDALKLIDEFIYQKQFK